MADRRRWLAPRPLQRASLLLAGLWSIGVLVAGSTVPVYETVVADSSGAMTSHRDTLVDENGRWVIVALALPLVISLVVACVLLMSTRQWTIPVAGVLTGILAVLNLLAMLTVGIFVLPVTFALAMACLCGVVMSRPTPAVAGPLDHPAAR